MLRGAKQLKDEDEVNSREETQDYRLFPQTADTLKKRQSRNGIKCQTDSHAKYLYLLFTYC